MADEPRREIGDLKGNFWQHMPLPYVVRVRATLSDDAPPVTAEYHLWAYSVMEAGIEASYEACGAIDQARVVVEHIEPDLSAYLAAVQQYELAKEMLRARRG